MSSVLAYLESQQVVHNDIKPANIAYSRQRGAVLLDFELAGQSNDPVTSGGTPWYVPPEYRTHNTRGTAGDIWAFGVTMLYVLRKMSLPEKMCMSWRIRDAVVEQSVAHMRMIASVNQVAQLKNELDRADVVEELVYSMLHEKPDLCIRAAHIVTVFETIRSMLHRLIAETWNQFTRIPSMHQRYLINPKLSGNPEGPDEASVGLPKRGAVTSGRIQDVLALDTSTRESFFIFTRISKN